MKIRKGHLAASPTTVKNHEGNLRRLILMGHRLRSLRSLTEQSEAILGIFRRLAHTSHIHCSRKILKST